MSYQRREIPFEECSELQLEGLAYWRSLPRANGQDLPLATDFKLIELPPSIIPTTHLVDVIDAGNEFRFRFWGDAFRDYLGYDVTGKTTKDMYPLEIGGPIEIDFSQVVTSRREMASVTAFDKGPIAKFGFQRIIRCPLADADGSVIQILSMVEYLMDQQELLNFVEESAAAAGKGS